MVYKLTEQPPLQHEIDAMDDRGAEGEDTDAKEAEIKSVAMMPLANPKKWFRIHANKLKWQH